MNIKRGPLVFHNVVTKGISEEGFSLEELGEINLNLLKKGVFMTGPIILEGKWGKGYQRVMIPMSQEVEFIEHASYSCDKLMQIEDGFFLRNGEEDFNEVGVRTLLEMVAQDLEVELTEKYYCIILNVYGGKLYDIYVPIKK